MVTGEMLIAAGVLQGVRLAPWAGERTLADRLVLFCTSLCFLPLGCVLTGVSRLVSAIPVSAGLHAWTAGALGLMTIAVMTRASLGHTGRPLSGDISGAGRLCLRVPSGAAAGRRCLHGLVAAVGSGLCAVGARLYRFALVYTPLLARHKPAWAELRC
jgi:uncharacterized protein involved in response to NO